MFSIEIPPVSFAISEQLQFKIDSKTKPFGALGKIEKLALHLGSIQNTLEPVLKKPAIVVFAGDHGIVAEGVSAYPQEVTYQMVMNFLAGGAAINVFGRQHGIEVLVVDAGVAFDFPPHPHLMQAKVAKGTRNYSKMSAMTPEQCDFALKRGATIVSELHEKGCNAVGFGEMGIGNSSSAAILMSLFCRLPLEDCVGRGAGMDDIGLERKKKVLKKAITTNRVDGSPQEILSTFGGFEIVMMCGAFLQAAALQMVILVDGFIASASLLAASKMAPEVLGYCVFSHLSDEIGHRTLLKFLQADPLLNLDLRLGEGTGIAIAYPLLESAVNFVVEMASFQSAGVSEKNT